MMMRRAMRMMAEPRKTIRKTVDNQFTDLINKLHVLADYYSDDSEEEESIICMDCYSLIQMCQQAIQSLTELKVEDSND